jgi:hypothetical protein
MQTPRAAARLLLPLLVLALAAPLGAAPDEAQGPLYRNQDLGLKLPGPPGWRMTADRQGASPWTRLVTFFDPPTGAEAVLSRRDRASKTLEDFRAWIDKEWRSDKTFQVSGIRQDPATALKPLGTIVVDATYVAQEKVGNAPAVAVPYQVVATYWLGPTDEYLLYARGKAAVWGKVRGRIDAMQQGFTLERTAAEVPKGAGAYVDDEHGFSCRFPQGYSVHVPRRAQHVVDFEGLAADDPLLGVYHFTWDGDLDKDAERLVAYYVNDLAGEATIANVEVGGRSGRLVTANANVGGKDELVLLAVLQRERGEFFRIRASMPKTSETAGRALFEQFLKDFKLGPRPR